VSEDESGSASPPLGQAPNNQPTKSAEPPPRAFRQWLQQGITVGAILGLLGTLIASYFNYLSEYQTKVATQAKEDLLAATQAFTQTSADLSTAITLQADLFHDFEAAVLDQRTDGEPNDLASKNATEVFKAYETASSGLRQNIHVFARKAELYLDWPSDLNRDRITH
jgi:hypothetical protein